MDELGGFGTQEEREYSIILSGLYLSLGWVERGGTPIGGFFAEGLDCNCLRLPNHCNAICIPEVRRCIKTFRQRKSFVQDVQTFEAVIQCKCPFHTTIIG